MDFVLPFRPPKSVKAPKTPTASKTAKTLQPPPESPRRRPSLAARAGVVKRRSTVVPTFNAPSMSFFEAMFGDDFPDAFVNNDGRSCKSRKNLLDLPVEILEVVCQVLSKMDIKRLRLTNRKLSEMVELRIDRVYISPNRANLDCLNTILNHPRYHLRVQEIVWDDAQLDEYPTFQHFCQALDSDGGKARVVLEDHLQTLIRSGDDNDAEYKQISMEDCVQRDGTLTDTGKAILLGAEDRKSRDIIASNAPTMSVEESYDLYQKLYQDEKEIIKRNWDVSGLQRALTELPNLKCITLTSEVWRPWNPIPTYDTSFFRALPAGFRKPSLWPWIDRRNYPQPQPHLRKGGQWNYEVSEQRLPAQWRGYSVIMSSLVTCPVPHLQEFVLDVGNEMIGLPHELFALPNIDYINTMRVLNTTPLKKLQLSIIDYPGVKSPGAEPPGQFCVGLDLLKYIINAAPHLEHLDLKFSILSQDAHLRFPFEDGFIEWKCRNLKHIALRHVSIGIDWLFNLVTKPEKLETVILDKVRIVGPVGQHSFETKPIFFTRLKDHFAAASRQGPSFTFIDEILSLQVQGSHEKPQRWHVLDDELNGFLYDSGQSPFNTMDELVEQRDVLRSGFGWIMDGRDPTFRKNRSEIVNGPRKMPRNP